MPDTTHADKPDLQGLLQKWQRILRLQDWDVLIRYRRAFDIAEGKQGTVGWLVTKKSADIRILDPVDYDPDSNRPQDVEKTIVHGLLHLHFALIDDCFGSGLTEKYMEQAIDAISCALVDRDRQSAHTAGWTIFLSH